MWFRGRAVEEEEEEEGSSKGFEEEEGDGGKERELASSKGIRVDVAIGGEVVDILDPQRKQIVGGEEREEMGERGRKVGVGVNTSISSSSPFSPLAACASSSLFR